MPTSRTLARTTAAAVAVALVPSVAAFADPAEDHQEPRLIGRAVLPVATYADGPPSGSFFAGVPQPPHVINSDIEFPLPSQPVEGFSAIVEGRSHGEFLAMPDNGFGNKANSFDFLIRAYYIRPDFKTRHGGSGTVDVDADEGEFIEFRDPNGLIGFPITNGTTPERLLTGADIDPESLQRGHDGDLWVGDEFGPWILHFDADGVLLDAPFECLACGRRATRCLGGQPATQPGSRGFEGMAISPNGKFLYAALEGPTVAELDEARRYIFEFDARNETFTGNEWQYRAENADQTLDLRHGHARRGHARCSSSAMPGAVARRCSAPSTRSSLEDDRLRRVPREDAAHRPRRHPRPRPGLTAADPRGRRRPWRDRTR